MRCVRRGRVCARSAAGRSRAGGGRCVRRRVGIGVTAGCIRRRIGRSGVGGLVAGRRLLRVTGVDVQLSLLDGAASPIRADDDAPVDVRDPDAADDGSFEWWWWHVAVPESGREAA